MSKITDEDYILPTIEALQGIQELGSGTTKPMLIRGVNRSTGDKGDYVVKYVGSPRMSPEASCRELLALFIAKQLEVKCAEPVLIHVSNEFVDSLVGNDGWRNANNSVGINFGTEFIGVGFLEFSQNQQLTPEQFEQSQNIFAFDVFLTNPDRRKEKQNLLTDGKDIVIFDHEIAFGFVFDITSNPTPWIIKESDKGWIKNHIFYPVLKDNLHNFDNFVQGLEMLDANFWEKAYALMPNPWKTAQLDTMRDKLISIVANRAIFLEGLNNVLQ